MAMVLVQVAEALPTRAEAKVAAVAEGYPARRDADG